MYNHIGIVVVISVNVCIAVLLSLVLYQWMHAWLDC